MGRAPLGLDSCKDSPLRDPYLAQVRGGPWAICKRSPQITSIPSLGKGERDSSAGTGMAMGTVIPVLQVRKPRPQEVKRPAKVPQLGSGRTRPHTQVCSHPYHLETYQPDLQMPISAALMRLCPVTAVLSPAIRHAGWRCWGSGALQELHVGLKQAEANCRICLHQGDQSGPTGGHQC